MTTTSTEVRATKDGFLGLILLNRPKARNALTVEMVDELKRALEHFQFDQDVTSVMVKSDSNDTFCAGGDVRAIYFLRKENRHEEADAFFEREFALNAYIANYPKPYIALINGNCFGGGMGISIHGRHRIVGEGAALAMPETAIGYFPDIGASFFLNQMPKATARFVGLTGYPLSPADAFFTGLATAYVRSEHHEEIEKGLSLGVPIKSLVDELGENPGESRLAQNIELIERCFGLNSIEEIKMALSKEVVDFAQLAREKLQGAAPSSLTATLDLLERAKDKSLDECLAIELDLARRVTRGPDFAEGVRALLVDKDRSPNWSIQR